MKQITLHPRTEQSIRWTQAARSMGRPVPAFLAFAADWTARYFRERERRKRPDAVAVRITETRLARQLLDAARLCVEYVPQHADTLRGRIHLRRELERALDDVRHHCAEHGEWE